jgi:hypothetical protein
MVANTCRPIQFPPILPTPPKHPQILPFSSKDLDTTVSHLHLPGTVAGYAVWITKLSCATALPPKGTGEGEVGIQNLNTVITNVSHIDLVIAGTKCNA